MRFKEAVIYPRLPSYKVAKPGSNIKFVRLQKLSFLPFTLLS